MTRGDCSCGATLVDMALPHAPGCDALRPHVTPLQVWDAFERADATAQERRAEAKEATRRAELATCRSHRMAAWAAWADTATDDQLAALGPDLADDRHPWECEACGGTGRAARDDGRRCLVCFGTGVCDTPRHVDAEAAERAAGRAAGWDASP